MWFIKDPCGIFCAGLTFGIMLTVSSLTTKVAILELHSENYINATVFISIYAILLGLAGVSHLVCMLTDPGAVETNSSELCKDEPGPQCLKCNCVKPPRAHHCSVCQRCILKMDHHCPWVNNCVGKYNQKHFILFMFYIFLACLYTFGMLFLRGSYCLGGNEAKLCKRPREEASLDMFLGLMAFFMAGMFCLFTGVMIYDQLVCILNNTSGIEMLKNTPVEQRSSRINLEEAFGGKLGVQWFIPTPVRDNRISLEPMSEIP